MDSLLLFVVILYISPSIDGTQLLMDQENDSSMGSPSK